MSYNLLAATYEVLPNNVLSSMGYDVLKRIGPPNFTEEDQKYGAQVVQSLGKKLNGKKPYSTELKGPNLNRKFPDVYTGRHSTDQGNVSWLSPTMSFRAATWAYKTPGHSWQLVCQGKNDPALKAGLQVSKWMSASALTLFTNQEVLKDAQSEFDGYLKQYGYKDPVEGIPLPTFKQLYGIEREAVPGRSSSK